MKAKLAIFVAVVGLLAWYIDKDIPDGISNPRLMKNIFLFGRAFDRVATTLDILGIYPYYKSLRQFVSFFRTSVTVPEDILIQDFEFDAVPVRVYRPVKDTQGGYPGVIYYHGGGFIAGDLNTTDYLMIKLGSQLDIVIVSVQYSLAPESVFPKPLEECLAAAKYFLSNAMSFGADPHRVALMGESSGGHFAAAVGLKLRDQKFKIQPHRLVLAYPPLQALDFTLPSHVQNAPHLPFSSQNAAYFFSMYAFGNGFYAEDIYQNMHTSAEAKRFIYNNYMKHEDLEINYHYKPYKKPKLNYGDSDLWADIKDIFSSPYFAPLIADVSHLPDTCIVTVQYDVLRDEGLLFSQRLQKSGVKVNHIHVNHGYHGVLSMTGLIEEGDKLMADIVEDLRRNL